MLNNNDAKQIPATTVFLLVDFWKFLTLPKLQWILLILLLYYNFASLKKISNKVELYPLAIDLYFVVLYVKIRQGLYYQLRSRNAYKNKSKYLKWRKFYLFLSIIFIICSLTGLTGFLQRPERKVSISLTV